MPSIFHCISRLLPALLFLASSSSPPSFAMEMRVDGDVATLSGPVVASDCDELKSMLSKSSIKIVVLKDSGGGNAGAGYCTGALIRERGLSTVIRGRCASSCSRMWLGGVERSLEGPNSRVGLHGNYDARGGLQTDAPQKLRSWIPQYAPSVDRELMEKWIYLPLNSSMMYFYNDRAELCENKVCTAIGGRTARNAGLSTK